MKDLEAALNRQMKRCILLAGWRLQHLLPTNALDVTGRRRTTVGAKDRIALTFSEKRELFPYSLHARSTRSFVWPLLFYI